MRNVIICYLLRLYLKMYNLIDRRREFIKFKIVKKIIQNHFDFIWNSESDLFLSSTAGRVNNAKPSPQQLTKCFGQ
jgi:hypothetical protein